MKIPINIRVYGNIKFRGKCPKETIEQITFVSWVRRTYPDTHGLTLFHAKNEKKRKGAEFVELDKDKAMGFVKGCSDIHDHGKPSLCMEIKRQDHTQSTIDDDQVSYLLAAQKNHAFVCIALGHEAAIEAFNDWRILNKC